MIKTIKIIKLPPYFVIQKFFGSLFGITIVNDNKESIFWNTIEIGDKNNKKPLFENVDDKNASLFGNLFWFWISLSFFWKDHYIKFQQHEQLWIW